MVAIILVAVLWAALPVAIAQQACGERAKFMAKLEETYAEHPIAMGLTDKGAVIEVFASENGSWTFLLTLPDGLTCVVASGRSWESLAAPEEKLL